MTLKNQTKYRYVLINNTWKVSLEFCLPSAGCEWRSEPRLPWLWIHGDGPGRRRQPLPPDWVIEKVRNLPLKETYLWLCSRGSCGHISPWEAVCSWRRDYVLLHSGWQTLVIPLCLTIRLWAIPRGQAGRCTYCFTKSWPNLRGELWPSKKMLAGSAGEVSGENCLDRASGLVLWSLGSRKT